MTNEISAFCELPFRKIKVTASGEVSMCCYQSGSLGNLLKTPFDTIWNSAMAEEVRRQTEAGSLHPMCVGWGGCPFICAPREPKSLQFEHAYPTKLELDLPNTHCNIGGVTPTPETACFMCPRSLSDFQAEPDITLELVDNLKFLMPYLKHVTVQGISELFWKNRVFEVLDRLGFEPYKHHCHFSAYSNAIVFNEAPRAQFIEACPDSHLIFSIDAATPETYIKIRRLPAFERVTANIRAFVAERTACQVSEIANNLNMINLGEAVQMVELAADLGVDAIQFNPTHDGGTGREDLRHLQVNNDNYLEFARMQDRIAERAEQLGLICQFIRPLALNYPTTEIPLHPVAIPTLIGQRESRWRSLLRLATRN